MSVVLLCGVVFVVGVGGDISRVDFFCYIYNTNTIIFIVALTP